MKLTELIARAPWREAVTYRDTWPHEYVLSEKDGQRELLNAIHARFQDGEGVDCSFFRVSNKYLIMTTQSVSWILNANVVTGVGTHGGMGWIRS